MKRYMRWLSVLLVVAMLVGGVPVYAENDQEGGNAGAIRAEEVQYFSYYDKHVSTPFATESIKLLAEEATLGEGAALEAVHIDRAAVTLSQSEMSWKINVPQNARYILKLTYIGEEENVRDNSIKVTIDGELPFTEANSCKLSRVFKNAPIETDESGDDRRPMASQAPV